MFVNAKYFVFIKARKNKNHLFTPISFVYNKKITMENVLRIFIFLSSSSSSSSSSKVVYLPPISFVYKQIFICSQFLLFIWYHKFDFINVYTPLEIFVLINTKNMNFKMIFCLFAKEIGRK